MSRIVNRPIQVIVRYGEPYIITDGENTYTVESVLDKWVESGAWWDGEPERSVFRVLTTEQFMFDVERVAEKWSIYKVWD